MRKVILLVSLLVLVMSPHSPSRLLAQPHDRRATGTTGDLRYEFYAIDSDDESPLHPTYRFIDTTFGSWTRVTGFTSTHDGYALAPVGMDSVFMPFYLPVRQLMERPAGDTVPGTSITTNGTICLFRTDSSHSNTVLPSPDVRKDLVAPLWGEWELLASGANRTNVYVRMVAPDSFFVSFYDLGLKGTNGQVRATFQVIFSAKDTSITFAYKSFDGSWMGLSAAALIQRVVTIGMTGGGFGYGITYLHRGNYFATSSTGHAQNLHNGLAIRFTRFNKEAFAVSNITFPPNDRYEMTSNAITPACRIFNASDTDIMVQVLSTITNRATGVAFYNRHDSVLAGRSSYTSYTAPSYQGLNPGSYKLTMTLSYMNGTSDCWADNNTATRYFVSLGTASVPMREEFNAALSPTLWSGSEVEVRDATSIMYVPDAPITGTPKALVMNRLDATGQQYASDIGGDTLVSAPMDLSGQTGAVNLYFHYQRGLLTDSSNAGILARLHSGPDMAVRTQTGNFAPAGDTLLVEGLLSTGPRWNPQESDWGVIGAIPGGFDTRTQTFRAQLASQYLHDHFRIRFRMKARNDANLLGFLEDNDNFVIDALHVEPWQIHKTELEPIDLDLGNGTYTHVPRDISGGLTPKVRIMNNGDDVALGKTKLHLRISDALGRAVYDAAILVDIPSPQSDQVFAMPPWDIHGSQGGVFTGFVTLEATDYDLYHANDTNRFYKTMYIDDQYALDDAQPDSLVGVTTANTNFIYDFTPIGNDTLRGASFYYTGASATANWTLAVTANGQTQTRTFSVTPNAAGWYRATFAPIAMRDTTAYKLHFTMSSGANLGGDASMGLVYYTVIDSTVANNRYGVQHPEILGLFHFPAGTPSYASPREADAAAGGYILPMFRLTFSGASNYLPVTLASISAHRDGGGAAVVEWRTAHEESAIGYDVERKRDGSIIGGASARNALRGASYATVDETASAAREDYSLFERDLDGARTLIGAASCEALSSGASGAGSATPLKAYPDPADGLLRVEGARVGDMLEIVDLLGAVVRSVPVPAGGNLAIGVTDLPSGSYLVRATRSAGADPTELSNGVTAPVRITIRH